MSNRTFTIIKPDSVRKGNFGKIIDRLESEGFRVLGLKKVSLSQKQAESFYGVHRERPFFGDLVRYMTSGPVYVAALQRDGAVAHLRKVMGATDPAKADEGTLRREFGTSIGNNATHGSDAPETAAFELGYFFRGMELV